MTKLADYPITDFSGGVRNDRSDFQKRDNEVNKLINFDVDDIGRLTKRLGSQQFGTTGAGSIGNSIYWEKQTAGATPSAFHLVNNNASTAKIYNIVGTQLDGAVAAGATSIKVVDVGLFAGSGTIEIDGDLITYSGTSGGDTFTGCGASVTSAHVTDAPVHQFVDLTGTSVNGTIGVYYATLNNLLFINGRAGSSTFDGSTMTAVGDADEPNGVFATVYRQRVYLIDSGAAGGVPIRVYRSDAGDATSWTATEFFDVEDKRGEVPTGQIVTSSDELLIFKRNSFFSYNEVNLKQRDDTTGAYNHEVIQEINGLIYTFCPAGIFVTNGLSSKLISDPVKDWIKDFIPIRDTTIGRVVTNTFATVYKNKYILYVGDVITPGSYSDVALVYDTKTKKWTVYSDLTNLTHLRGLSTFKAGNNPQGFEQLFGGTSDAKYFRFFSKKYREQAASGSSIIFETDGDIHKDFISDTGVLISSYGETRYYDLKTPGWIKEFGSLRVIGESAGFTLAYKIEGRKGETSWKPLGTTERINQCFAIPKEDIGYRIKFRISHDSTVFNPTLNALILEDAKTISRN